MITFAPWMRAGTLLAALASTQVGAAFATVIGPGGSGVISGSPGASWGYKASLDEAAVVWDLSNGADSNYPVPLTGPEGVVDALNVLRASETRQGEAKLTEVMATWGTRVKVTERVQAQVFLPGESLNLNQGTGAIQTVAGSGGVLWSAPPILGLGDGGEVSIGNLRVDLVNQIVWANITGTPASIDGETFPTFTWNDTPLFSFASVSGVQGLSANAVEAGWRGDLTGLQAEGWTVQSAGVNALGLVGWAELKGLRVTDEARDGLIYSLGIVQGSTAYNVMAGLNSFAEGWGKVRVGLGMRVTDLSLAPSTTVLPPVRLVPEPGTYALMGLGLVGLALVRARRQA
jgi:PEP-CTERM motif